MVIGNESVADDVTFTLQIPLGAMGLDSGTHLAVTDGWTKRTRRVPIQELGRYAVTVPKDRSAGGGVRVLLITADLGKTRAARAESDFFPPGSRGPGRLA